MPKEYAAAIVTFLNRETNKEETGYMYPITKLELKNIKTSTQKIYIVENGNWVEEVSNAKAT